MKTANMIGTLNRSQIEEVLNRQINGRMGLRFHNVPFCNNKDLGITRIIIQPGKPLQNGYVDRCNGSISRELLNAYVFRTMDEVRQQAEIWRTDYNEERPMNHLVMYHRANTQNIRTIEN